MWLQKGSSTRNWLDKPDKDKLKNPLEAEIFQLLMDFFFKKKKDLRLKTISKHKSYELSFFV